MNEKPPPASCPPPTAHCPRAGFPYSLRYDLFFGWLVFTAVLLLAPADEPGSRAVPQSFLDHVRCALSGLVIWAEKDSSLWHTLWFLILGALAACLPARMTSLRKPLVLFFALNGAGLVAEFVQDALIPGRAFEWADIAFNGLGIALGLGTVGGWRWRQGTGVRGQTAD